MQTIHLNVLENSNQIPLDSEQIRVVEAVSPSVALERVSEGVTITVRDLHGEHSETVYDGSKGESGPKGDPGEPGYTPVKGVDYFDGQDGQPGRDGQDGAPGQDGQDGVSPTITVTDITGGHRVTITDADGAHSFDVMDGDAADAPVQSVNGKTGAVVLEAADVGAGTYSKPAGGIPASDLAAGVIPEVPVQDVQVNGVSVLDAQGVANISEAVNNGSYGVVKISSGNGIGRAANGYLYVVTSTDAQVKSGTNSARPISPLNQHLSTFYGLAKAAGSDEKNSTLPVGQYTDEAKVAIQKMLGVYREWELIADVTVSEDSRIFDVDTDISGQPFTLSEMFVRAYLEPSTTGANDYIAAANLTVTTDDTDTNTSGTTQRYLANGAATYLEYQSKIISGVTLTRGRAASAPNSSQSTLEISSPTSNTKAFRGFRLSRYNSTSSLIPAGSRIMIYGIRA